MVTELGCIKFFSLQSLQKCLIRMNPLTLGNKKYKHRRAYRQKKALLSLRSQT